MAELFTFESDDELGVVDPEALEVDVTALLAVMCGSDPTAVRRAVLELYGRSASPGYTGLVVRAAASHWTAWAIDEASPVAVVGKNLESAVYAIRALQVIHTHQPPHAGK